MIRCSVNYPTSIAKKCFYNTATVEVIKRSRHTKHDRSQNITKFILLRTAKNPQQNLISEWRPSLLVPRANASKAARHGEAVPPRQQAQRHAAISLSLNKNRSKTKLLKREDMEITFTGRVLHQARQNAMRPLCHRYIKTVPKPSGYGDG